MSKPKLLVIDDLDSARQMMKRTLGRAYDVFDFASVAEALPAAPAEGPAAAARAIGGGA